MAEPMSRADVLAELARVRDAVRTISVEWTERRLDAIAAAREAGARSMLEALRMGLLDAGHEYGIDCVGCAEGECPVVYALPGRAEWPERVLAAWRAAQASATIESA